MILSGRNDAPARGHGYSGTAAPTHPCHQASVRSLFSCQEHTGWVVLNGLQCLEDSRWAT